MIIERPRDIGKAIPFWLNMLNACLVLRAKMVCDGACPVEAAHFAGVAYLKGLHGTR